MCTLLGFCTHLASSCLGSTAGDPNVILGRLREPFLCTKEHISISADHGENNHPRIPFFFGAGFGVTNAAEGDLGAEAADPPPRLPT